jgi:hypothetical protein
MSPGGSINRKGCRIPEKFSGRHPLFYAGNGAHIMRQDPYIGIITKIVEKVQILLKLKRKNQNKKSKKMAEKRKNAQKTAGKTGEKAQGNCGFCHPLQGIRQKI